MKTDVQDAIDLIDRRLGMLSSDELFRKTYPEEKEPYRKALSDALALIKGAELKYLELREEMLAIRHARRQELLDSGLTSQQAFDIIWEEMG